MGGPDSQSPHWTQSYDTPGPLLPIKLLCRIPLRNRFNLFNIHELQAADTEMLPVEYVAGLLERLLIHQHTQHLQV